MQPSVRDGPVDVVLDDGPQALLGIGVAAQMVHQHRGGLFEKLGLELAFEGRGELVAGADDIAPLLLLARGDTHRFPRRQIVGVVGHHAPEDLVGLGGTSGGQQGPTVGRLQGSAPFRSRVDEACAEGVGAGVGVVAAAQALVEGHAGGGRVGASLEKVDRGQEGVVEGLGPEGDRAGTHAQQPQVGRRLGVDVGDATEGEPRFGAGLEPAPVARMAADLGPACPGVRRVLFQDLLGREGGPGRIDAAVQGETPDLAEQRDPILFHCLAQEALARRDARTGIGAAVG